MLQVTDISKEYGAKQILSEVSFTVLKGEKIAVVGKNGSGKSTLLKIIAGIETIEQGDIKIGKKESIAYLPQKIDDKYLNTEVLDYLIKITNSETYEIEKTFSNLNLDPGILNKKIKNISGGQKTKICLVQVILKKADYVLLDEPTNNLDIDSLLWLEGYIKKNSAGFLIVSHDRKFLDNIASKVLEIKDGGITLEKGTYSDYLQRSKEKRSKLLSDYEGQQEEINRLKKSAADKKRKASIGNKYETKDNDKMLRNFKREQAKHSNKEAKRIEKRIELMDEIEEPEKQKQLNIDIKESGFAGNKSITIRDLIIGYEDFSAGPFNLDINFGDKICFVGPNGSGKTTLLKTIIGSLEKKSGDLIIGSKVKFGNLTQEHEDIPNDITLFDFISENTDKESNFIFNTLKKFNFNEKQIKKPVDNLSPGQKTRLILALFTIKEVNTIVLDEPTNHLDIEALESIEEAIIGYKGTIILVSHDRHLIDKIKPDSIYKISQDSIRRI